jgi:transcriptional regulator of acetoin/glycerol metabolism
VRVRDLPEEMQIDDASAPPEQSALPKNCARTAVDHRPDMRDASRATLARAERDTLLDAIRGNDGNLVRAARALGISRNALYRKL